MNERRKIRIVEVEDMRTDAGEERSPERIEELAPPEKVSLAAIGVGFQGSHSTMHRGLGRAPDGNSGPVEDRTDCLLSRRCRYIPRFYGYSPIRKDAGGCEFGVSRSTSLACRLRMRGHGTENGDS